MNSGKTLPLKLQNELSIIVPVLNEKEGITLAISQVQTVLPNAEVIIVDDGSTDGTSKLIDQIKAVRVIHHDFNQGYGAALKSGMALTKRKFIAWFDGDCEHKVEDLVNVVDHLVTKSLAAAIGQRPAELPNYRGIGKMLIFSTAKLFGLRFRGDLNCGLRVFRRDAILPYLTILPDKYSASMTSTMIMLEKDYPIEFVAIKTNPRKGTSKVRLIDGFSALIQVLRMIMLFAPLRIFLPLGLCLVLAGSCYGVWLTLLTAKGIPTLSVITVLTGVILCVQGLIADQLSALRLCRLSVHEQNDTNNTNK
jgi:glycosyltransferase involved in cell wall biosynthesis